MGNFTGHLIMDHDINSIDENTVNTEISPSQGQNQRQIENMSDSG